MKHLKSMENLPAAAMAAVTALLSIASAVAITINVSRLLRAAAAAALPPHAQYLACFLPAFAAAAVLVYFVRRSPAVYLVDYACFKGSHRYRTPFASFVENARQVPMYNGRTIRFFERLLETSGLGEETYTPPALSYIPLYKYCTLDAGREEAELVVFSAIDDLFAKTSVLAETIDILVVNCSAFNPTPSFPDVIINRYKMRADIRSVHLSGMGCSAGMIAVELARNLLMAAPRGARALVVSTETLSPNFYAGNERAMLVPCVLFRMGGAAALLSTSSAKARFRMRSVVRTLTAAEDSSYRCIQQEEDGKGNIGVNLSMNLMVIAGRTLKANITALAPVVFPAREQLRFAMSLVSQKLHHLINGGGGGGRSKSKSPPPPPLYVPNFMTAFEHFCIHAGGRAVIDEIQRSLGLSDEHVEPSRMTLHRFGNTSSSSTWYELAYIEAKGRMLVGDRVWMMGFGSGFKCNSAVLECIAAAAVVPPDAAVLDGPWAGCIHRYPVHCSKSP